jgi:hypothetical protein
VDVSGSIVASDIHGDYEGGRELAEPLASSEQVRDCAVTRWFGVGVFATRGWVSRCVPRCAWALCAVFVVSIAWPLGFRVAPLVAVG